MPNNSIFTDPMSKNHNNTRNSISEQRVRQQMENISGYASEARIAAVRRRQVMFRTQKAILAAMSHISFYHTLRESHNALLRHYYRQMRPLARSFHSRHHYLRVPIVSSRAVPPVLLSTSLSRYSIRMTETPSMINIHDPSKNQHEDTPEFPLTPEATFVFFSHIRKYLNEEAWDYHGLRDVIKGLLVDFRLHLERVMVDLEEKQGDRQLKKRRDRDNLPDDAPISFHISDTIDNADDTESDPEDINEIVKKGPQAAISARLKDMVQDPELERTEYAEFLIEICERIPDVYHESLKHLEDDEAVREYTKEQFSDLLASLEMHIHSMANLTMSPDVPEWVFGNYRVVSGPVIYNYLLEAAVELADGYIYGTLLRKMKDDHVGLNQYSFELMMRFGERASKNNLVYAQELMKYMQERDIEPSEETLEIYKRIQEKFAGDAAEDNAQFDDVYRSDMSGRPQDDSVPKLRTDPATAKRSDVSERIDLSSDRSDDLIRDALQSDKYKPKVGRVGGITADVMSSGRVGSGFLGGPPRAETETEEPISLDDEDVLDSLISGEAPTPADDVPRVQHGFSSNVATMYNQARPLRHPAEGPPKFNLPDDDLSSTSSLFGSEFSKYNVTQSTLKNTETKSVNEDDEAILKKFGLTPEELERELRQDLAEEMTQQEVFGHKPGSREDLEEVNASARRYMEKGQKKAQNADSLYAAGGAIYDAGFFDPYAQPMKGYDPDVVDQFTEDDFYVEDPKKATRKVFKPKESDFDAYAEDDILAEFKKKQAILEKQKQLEREKTDDKDDTEEDTWCDPMLKL